MLIIGQVKSNNLDIKQSIKPQIRAVLLIKEPLLLEHFIIDTIAVIKCPFSKRKSQVNIIRSNRDKIVGRYTPETKFYLKENRRGKNEFLLKTLEISNVYTHFELRYRPPSKRNVSSKNENIFQPKKVLSW